MRSLNIAKRKLRFRFPELRVTSPNFPKRLFVSDPRKHHYVPICYLKFVFAQPAVISIGPLLQTIPAPVARRRAAQPAARAFRKNDAGLLSVPCMRSDRTNSTASRRSSFRMISIRRTSIASRRNFPPIASPLLPRRSAERRYAGCRDNLLSVMKFWSGRRDSNPRPQPWQGSS